MKAQQIRPRAFRSYVERLAGDSNVFRSSITRAWHWLACTARLAIGIPDYEAYCSHVRDRHADTTPMTREEFFRDRLQARYGRGRSRCC